MSSLGKLLDEVRACTRCAPHLPHSPRPVLQLDAAARILIAGQAPGRAVHASGVPFDDASGERLRTWLGLTRARFYDPQSIAILPLGFCFPGTTRAGDLPPRSECAPAWRAALLAHLDQLQLTIVLGRYAQAYHLPAAAGGVTAGEARSQVLDPQQSSGQRRDPIRLLPDYHRTPTIAPQRLTITAISSRGAS